MMRYTPRFVRQFLSAIAVLLLLFSVSANAQEWYIGHWIPDVERTLGPLSEADKEVRSIVGAIELVIDDKHIYKVAWGSPLPRYKHEIIKLSDTKVLLKAKNGFGMTETEIHQDGKHILVIPRVEYDRYGPFKPLNPIVNYYVRAPAK